MLLVFNKNQACLFSYLWTCDLNGPVRNALMRANPLGGHVGGGWALEIETFLGLVKWHQA